MVTKCRKVVFGDPGLFGNQRGWLIIESKPKDFHDSFVSVCLQCVQEAVL